LYADLFEKFQKDACENSCDQNIQLKAHFLPFTHAFFQFFVTELLLLIVIVFFKKFCVFVNIFDFFKKYLFKIPLVLFEPLEQSPRAKKLNIGIFYYINR